MIRSKTFDILFITRLIAIAWLFALVFSLKARAQESTSHDNHPGYKDTYYDSLLNSMLKYDSLLLSELEADSLSFLDLLDQLISMDNSLSSFSIRTGYNSNILNAGRDFGFKQFGFSGGLSYFNKSGIFLDLNGYWNSEVEPNYNLTVTSAGYMGFITPRWSILGSYDHYFYNLDQDETSDSYPLNNSLNFSSYYDLKWASVGFDYGFLFGKETAHRIRPNISGVLRFRDLGFIDRITLMPGISGLWGNQTILVSSPNYQLIQQLIRRIGMQRFRQLYRYKPEVIEGLILTDYSEQDSFGFMNYSINFPVYVYIGNLGISASYVLNFPVALPGEELDLSMNTYFGISATYTFYFK